MALWRRLTRGLRVLVDRGAADRDVADEVQHYLDEAAAALMAEGLSPDAARRAARVEMGPTLAVREQVRASGWEHAMDTLLSDLRHGGRRLRGQPGTAAVSILTLALGIGASTAIFSAVKPILIEPLPYPRAERVTMIWDRGMDGGPDDDYMADEFQHIYLSRRANPQPLGDRPLVVLIGSRPSAPPPGTSEEFWRQLGREKDEQKADLPGLSRNARLVRDASSGHEIHRDNPALVARAIDDVLEAISRHARLVP